MICRFHIGVSGPCLKSTMYRLQKNLGKVLKGYSSQKFLLYQAESSPKWKDSCSLPWSLAILDEETVVRNVKAEFFPLLLASFCNDCVLQTIT